MLRALGSASCDITHETRGNIRNGHWVLRLVISHTRQGDVLLRALGFASFDITHETRAAACDGHWVVCLVISNDTGGYDLLRALTSASCDITDETAGTICYGHWVLRFVISHTRQRVGFVRGMGFCVLRYHTRDKGYDLLRVMGSASCDITHETAGTICYEHWVLCLVISHTRQGVRLVTGIGFCVL